MTARADQGNRSQGGGLLVRIFPPLGSSGGMKVCCTEWLGKTVAALWSKAGRRADWVMGILRWELADSAAAFTVYQRTKGILLSSVLVRIGAPSTKDPNSVGL